ncbi:hypothetical protein OPV22_022709 [Ensete ventricosum]|uniref:Uncharacterized protein n=1 Tax=Ensete ventricosum TaxID=4639 RepID=A0AAV8QRD6_ENSVE|nr:hypothetical protein OPV22_022709 [Ensete ventricosum]
MYQWESASCRSPCNPIQSRLMNKTLQKMKQLCCSPCHIINQLQCILMHRTGFANQVRKRTYGPTWQDIFVDSMISHQYQKQQSEIFPEIETTGLDLVVQAIAKIFWKFEKALHISGIAISL